MGETATTIQCKCKCGRDVPVKALENAKTKGSSLQCSKCGHEWLPEDIASILGGGPDTSKTRGAAPAATPAPAAPPPAAEKPADPPAPAADEAPEPDLSAADEADKADVVQTVKDEDKAAVEADKAAKGVIDDVVTDEDDDPLPKPTAPKPTGKAAEKAKAVEKKIRNKKVLTDGGPKADTPPADKPAEAPKEEVPSPEEPKPDFSAAALGVVAQAHVKKLAEEAAGEDRPITVGQLKRAIAAFLAAL